MLKNYIFWKDYKFFPLNNFINTNTNILYFYSLFNLQKKNFKTFFLINSTFLLNFLFFKKKNLNKLYLNNDYILLSPGIVLKYNNLFKKNLKNKTNMWGLFFLLFTKLKTFTLCWNIKNFYVNQIKLIKFLKKFNLLNSLVFMNFFKQNFVYKYKTIRRLKKWIKKKYFKISI